MLKFDYDKVYEIGLFWGEKFPMMVMKECGELIQAISKYERNKTKETYDKLQEEIRDVYISLEVLRYHMGMTDRYMNELIKEKLNKKYEEEQV